MSIGRHAEVRRLFLDACRLEEGERARWLEGACGGDRDLLAEVEALLRADAAPEGPFERTSEGVEVLARALVEEEPPQDGDAITGTPPEIPGYDIERLLGRGAMGEVYEAVQVDSGRRVALKVLHPALASEEFLRRFRREVRVLGQLQHPGIAQILASGTRETSAADRPFFAMELVAGEPIDDYARTNELDVDARLELVARICDAVHYAHEKGVVHRDLKPANILVGGDTTSGSRPGVPTGDELPQPKVLDFGVARATDSDVATVTLHTSRGQLVGTVPYMSPEQAAGDPAAIDRRSDVYSTGVIAFELLAGCLPYGVRGKLVHEALRVIREDEPTSLGALDSSLRGDVETIVGKALEKDPARRYATAGELAQDLRRYSRSLPIHARPPSALYQVRKFARRNKALVGGAVATLVVALVGATIALMYALQATRRADEVFQLAALQDYDDLIASADELWPPYPAQASALKEWKEDAEALVADLPVHRAKRNRLRELAHLQGMETGSSRPEEWTFPDTEEGHEARWWHANLDKLIISLEGLVDERTGLLSSADDAVSPEHGWSVPRRLRFAERLRDLATGSDWHDRWAEATALITAHAAYGGLELSPQTGLLPIGPDPGSGLWEFWHVASGAEPVRREDGRLILTEEMGVVLVLIPGGTFWMGASQGSEAEQNHDPDAMEDEGPVHRVTLSPYFLSKYELTQAQWERATGSNPSRFNPLENADMVRSALHPVETVSWAMCDRTLRRLGLRLPTEAQWENGCRAGSTTARPFDRSDFPHHANVRDLARDRSKAGNGDPWDDGFTLHAPVGALQPNAFGLHDVLGNVWEWCADAYRSDFYGGAETLDPLCDGDGAIERVTRGGSFNDLAYSNRASVRHNFVPSFKSYSRGVRPAASLSE